MDFEYELLETIMNVSELEDAQNHEMEKEEARLAL
jgi:hypothetical protein